MDVVSKKLDLKTVSDQLEAGTYASRQEFLDDASMIFQNAIKYHGSRETKWISKPAKEMLKVVQREMKNMDKRPSKLLTKQTKSSGALKLKMKTPSAVTGKTPPSSTPAALLADDLHATAAPASAAAPAGASQVKPKVTLKLKTSTLMKSKDKTVSKAKPTQPKLKLKLSLGAKPATVEPATPAGASDAASTTSASKSKTTKPKLSGSRGKELPEGVAASTTTNSNNNTSATAKKTSTKKTKKPKKSTDSSSLPPFSGGGSTAVVMTPVRKVQCSKILAGLKRRKFKEISWFLNPVSDKNIVQDYRAKIKHPVCVAGIQNKLEKNEYKTVAHFVLDMRRMFANCLRFNTSMKDRLRPIAVDLLSTAEDLMATFLIREGQQQRLNTVETTNVYPPLLFCWSFCIKVLNTLFNLTNPSDGQPTVLYFLHPVTMYCGGQYPPNYLNVVKRPMDFGTITSK